MKMSFLLACIVLGAMPLISVGQQSCSTAGGNITACRDLYFSSRTGSSLECAFQGAACEDCSSLTESQCHGPCSYNNYEDKCFSQAWHCNQASSDSCSLSTLDGQGCITTPQGCANCSELGPQACGNFPFICYLDDNNVCQSLQHACETAPISGCAQVSNCVATEDQCIFCPSLHVDACSSTKGCTLSGAAPGAPNPPAGPPNPPPGGPPNPPPGAPKPPPGAPPTPSPPVAGPPTPPCIVASSSSASSMSLDVIIGAAVGAAVVLFLSSILLYRLFFVVATKSTSKVGHTEDGGEQQETDIVTIEMGFTPAGTLRNTNASVVSQRQDSKGSSFGNSLIGFDGQRAQRLKLIGRGANGSVYTCMLFDGSIIAVKDVLLQTDNPSILNDIQREVSILAQMDHPNVIKFFGSTFQAQDGRLSIFMELVSSGSLGSMVREMKQPMEEGVAKIYAKQMIGALAYIHERGIIHRDLKCDNLLLTQDGQVKLTDFGAAKSLGVGTMATKGGQTMVGTPYFIAPEVLLCGEGTDSGYGKRADVWSLGVTLLEMMNCGNIPWPPFPSTGAAFLHIATAGNIPIIPEFISPECRSFLLRCFNRDPKERSSSSELVSDPWILTPS